MLMSIMRDKDNLFIVNEIEMREMLYTCIHETLKLVDVLRPQMMSIPGLTPINTIFSVEQKEFIINKSITEQMKKMETEME